MDGSPSSSILGGFVSNHGAIDHGLINGVQLRRERVDGGQVREKDERTQSLCSIGKGKGSSNESVLCPNRSANTCMIQTWHYFFCFLPAKRQMYWNRGHVP